MNNLAYRISVTVLGIASLICAFFLKMFTFTLVIAKIYPKTYNFSIYDAIGKLTESGITLGGDDPEKTAKIMEAIAPMYKTTVAFFVLLAVTLLFILAISVISGVSNLHVPQAVLSGMGFILMVIAAGCAAKALGCLIGTEEEAAKVSLTALITASGLTTENALSALGSAFTNIQIASLSYGFYIIMAVLAIVFIWSIIAAVRYNSDQPQKTAKKHHKEYRRKKPIRKVF